MPLCSECKDEAEFSMAANRDEDEGTKTCSRYGKRIK